MLNAPKILLFDNLKLLYRQPYRLMYFYIGISFTVGTLTSFDTNHWLSEVFDISLGLASLYATFLRGVDNIYIIIALVLASAYGLLTLVGIAVGGAPISSAVFVILAGWMIYSGTRQLRTRK